MGLFATRCIGHNLISLPPIYGPVHLHMSLFKRKLHWAQHHILTSYTWACPTTHEPVWKLTALGGASLLIIHIWAHLMTSCRYVLTTHMWAYRGRFDTNCNEGSSISRPPIHGPVWWSTALSTASLLKFPHMDLFKGYLYWEQLHNYTTSSVGHGFSFRAPALLGFWPTAFGKNFFYMSFLRYKLRLAAFLSIN